MDINNFGNIRVLYIPEYFVVNNFQINVYDRNIHHFIHLLFYISYIYYFM